MSHPGAAALPPLLRDAFRVLVANLTSYRPYLPRHLMPGERFERAQGAEILSRSSCSSLLTPAIALDDSVGPRMIAVTCANVRGYHRPGGIAFRDGGTVCRFHEMYIGITPHRGVTDVAKRALLVVIRHWQHRPHQPARIWSLGTPANLEGAWVHPPGPVIDGREPDPPADEGHESLGDAEWLYKWEAGAMRRLRDAADEHRRPAAEAADAVRRIDQQRQQHDHQLKVEEARQRRRRRKEQGPPWVRPPGGDKEAPAGNGH
eukprot:gene5460-33629_t